MKPNKIYNSIRFWFGFRFLLNKITMLHIMHIATILLKMSSFQNYNDDKSKKIVIKINYL